MTKLTAKDVRRIVSEAAKESPPRMNRISRHDTDGRWYVTLSNGMPDEVGPHETKQQALARALQLDQEDWEESHPAPPKRPEKFYTAEDRTDYLVELSHGEEGEQQAKKLFYQWVKAGKYSAREFIDAVVRLGNVW